MVDQFDIGRATLNDRDMFKPYRVTLTEPLAVLIDSKQIPSDAPVLVVERHGEQLGFLHRN